MKFRFKIQQYQTDAVESVVRVFAGQPYSERVGFRRDVGNAILPGRASTRVHAEGAMEAQFLEPEDDTGFLNENLILSDGQLLHNIREIQQENNIRLSDSLVKTQGRCSLDIEMETGTGKTYVYIKTIFELNKRYGWSKFIVVVPSIAIREGVKKSFEITQDHFMELYHKKARFFIYNSGNLNQLDSFSSDSGINVMIINTQAFAASMNEEKNVEGRKGDAAARIIFSKRDEFGSRRPIDVIAANRPIIIMDEPQKMGGEVTQKTLAKFNPLFMLNYSATHARQHNLVYVLDALDAYNKRLVKRIEVKGFEVRNLRGTDSYMYLESIVLSQKKPPMARLEFEVNHKVFKRETHLLGVGDNLYFESNEMEQYKGYSIAAIDPIAATVTFTNGESIHKGDVVGDVSEMDMRRVQIRETIISHLEKEARLFDQGIKCLSLFFIDEVAKYRQYDEDGNEALGEYGRIFEEEYDAVVNDYRTLFDMDYLCYLDAIDTHETHRGYFSIDKKTGRAVDSKLKRGSEFSDDISAYDLILKNKERLLSFDEPTRFIFSHSALREGWDNPNVFQICTLKHGGDSTTQKRQEVGRGLRLCVNQAGDRMDAEEVGDQVQVLNTLTVVASEGYASFVKDLQDQTRAVLYDRPRKASIDYFEGKNVFTTEGQKVTITTRQATQIYQYLSRYEYIDPDNNITQLYRDNVVNNSLHPLPEALRPMQEGIHKLVQAIFDDRVLADMFQDGNKTPAPDNPLNERFYKEAFQTLWKSINHKYAYTVEFDTDELIHNAIKAINNDLSVSQLQYTVSIGSQREEISGEQMRSNDAFGAVTTKTNVLKHAEINQVKYDLIGKIAEGTVLTRRTVAAILSGIGKSKFDMFHNNPEEFIAKVIRLIREQKATMIVEHITYDTINGSYDESIFTAEKHGKSFDQAFPATKAIQDYVFTDGTAEKSVERKFVEKLDGSVEVNIYAKLPKGFHIPTPVGNYSPDWAIVFHEGKVKHIYFVAETKGSMSSMDLRPIERAKIDCAKKLFATISSGTVKYDHVDSYETLMNKVMQ